MIGTYFEGLRQAQFEKWLKRIIGRDSSFQDLLVPEFEEERLCFYYYFEKGFSPWKALQEEYRKFG